MSKFANWINILYLRQIATVSVLLKRDVMALRCWERIATMKPNDADVLATLAHFKAAHGFKTEAMRLMQESLAIDPSRSSVWFNLGFIQQEFEDHAGAVTSFDRSVELNPKQDRALYGKAISLIKLNQLDDAVVCLKLNTKLQPLSPFAWYQLGHVYAKQNDVDRVAKMIRKLASFEPQVAKQLERETGVYSDLNVVKDGGIAQ